MKLAKIICLSLLIVTITAGTTFVFSNVIDTIFLNVFGSIEGSNIQQTENEPILAIKSITYKKIDQANNKPSEFNELNATIEIWTPEGFSYYGNVHPFLLEIIDSEELTVINSQCYCSKKHEFPAGTSVYTTIGRIAYNTSPPELIDDIDKLPDRLLIKVYLEDTNLSDTYELSLKSENSNYIPKNTTLKIDSAIYDLESKKISILIKLWAETDFSYFGNLHPFVIEIMQSENLTFINDQCFCSKNHNFPEGYSTQSASGWLATIGDPALINSYPIPEFIPIRVSLGNKIYSDIFEAKLID